MSVRIARESDGRVSVSLSPGEKIAVLAPIEARLLAIKLLLAAERLEPSKNREDS